MYSKMYFSQRKLKMYFKFVIMLFFYILIKFNQIKKIIIFRESLWKIYYFMWDNCRPSCEPLDPDTLPVVRASEIQGNINFKSPQNTSYLVRDVPSIVDYRYHFRVNISREMRATDKVKFESAIRSVWNASSGVYCLYLFISFRKCF